MNDAAARLAGVRDAVAAAVREAGRDPDSVRLVAVGKTFPAETLQAVHDAGQRIFGENRVQEAVGKVSALPDDVDWHLIGHLQANKAGAAVRLFSTIHSVDSARLGRRLDRLAGEAGRALRGLVQVDLAQEPSKYGMPVEEVEPFLEGAREFRGMSMRGLMILPPHQPDPEGTRPWFRQLREMGEDLVRRGLLGRDGPLELSMGMSHDFPVAIQEGATLIRVGTAIFGERTSRKRPAVEA